MSNGKMIDAGHRQHIYAGRSGSQQQLRELFDSCACCDDIINNQWMSACQQFGQGKGISQVSFTLCRGQA